MKNQQKTRIGCKPFFVLQRKEIFRFSRQLAKSAFLVAISLGGFAGGTEAQTISTVAGTLKSACTTAPCGDGGLAALAKLYSPAGLALDGDGNIYISEYSNHSIRKIDITTGIITTVAGTQKSSCLTVPCGDGGQAMDAKLSSPRGIAIDPDGNLHIVDFSNHAIRKVDKTTGVITTVAGVLKSACSTTTCGEGELATTAKLNSPTGIAFDKNGNLYIADYGNNVIRKVTKSTGIITTVAGTMKTSCSTAPCGDGNQATSAFLNGPSGLVFDADGNMFIAEYNNHTIRRVDAVTGIMSTVTGTAKLTCTTAPCGDGGSATAARLTSPFAVTVDKNGNVFIADASNSAIRRIDKTTGIITTVAGTIKTSCGSTSCGDGGSATAAQITNPFGLTFNAAGDLYFIEYSNQVLRKVSFGSTLPMKFLSLSALMKNNRIEVAWQTADESGVDRYEIEKSAGAPQFATEGTVAAKTTGWGRNDYKWNDLNPSALNSQYRIKAIDRDGTAKYSPVINVKPAPGQPVLRLASNPVTDNTLHLQLTNVPVGEYEISLYSSEGRRVYSYKLTGSGGALWKDLALPSTLSRGIYTLYFGNQHQELGKQKLVLQ